MTSAPIPSLSLSPPHLSVDSRIQTGTTTPSNAKPVWIRLPVSTMVPAPVLGLVVHSGMCVLVVTVCLRIDVWVLTVQMDSNV